MTERQEVAARLRAKYYERYSEGWLEVQDLNFQALNENEDLMSCLPDGDMFKVLADLIDPTCEDVSEPPKDGFTPVPVFKCSECGCQHISPEYVRYCPNCGARVVSENE